MSAASSALSGGAEAEVVVGGVVQTLSSRGLWGIESDSDASYLKTVGEDEIDQLKDVLRSAGLDDDAIAEAMPVDPSPQETA